MVKFVDTWSDRQQVGAGLFVVRYNRAFGRTVKLISAFGHNANQPCEIHIYLIKYDYSATNWNRIPLVDDMQTDQDHYVGWVGEINVASPYQIIWEYRGDIGNQIVRHGFSWEVNR